MLVNDWLEYQENDKFHDKFKIQKIIMFSMSQINNEE